MMKELIRARALQLGFDACRFTSAAAPDHAEEFKKWLAAGNQAQMEYLARNAEKRCNPQLVLEGAHSIIVLAVSYHRDIPVQSGPGLMGQTARYSRFTDYHDILGERLKTLADYAGELGGGEHKSLWYVDTGPLLERDIAQRSGVGFVGKHGNLISRDLGNWIFLSEIITTVALEPDLPERNRCGSCTRCMEACPTNAITSPFNLDARRCISYLTIELKGSIPLEFRRLIGSRVYGCDDCLAACPWNRFAREGSMMRAYERQDLKVLDLLELLTLDDAGFKARFRGTPMLRTKRRGLLRNVCVALGNIGDERALPALEKAANDPEPLIAEHAGWALEEIKGRLKPRMDANRHE